MQVPHEEVHERVSSILKDRGFCPSEEDICVGNLNHYEDVLSKQESPYKHGGMNSIKKAKGTLRQLAEAEKVMKNKTPRGWELKYARRSFFPYWRSILSSPLPVKVIRATDKPNNLKQHQNSWNKLVGQGSPTIDLNIGLLASLQKSNHQPTRTFGSAALPLLKMLRNA